MNILGFSKKFRTAKRLREIVNVFIRHGFGNLVDQIHLGKFVPVTKRLKSYGNWPSLMKGPNAPERLRLAFEELGPSFVKFAQLLATRADLIPMRFSDEFKKLQDRVAPFPFDEVKSIVEENIPEPFEKVFRQFERIPIGAASIAQVHRAVLHDGTDVIAKIQRPNIKENIDSDIEILFNVARLLETYVPDSRFLNPVGIVREFQKTVEKELNFIAESRNCERMRNNFEDVPYVHVPKACLQFVTDKIIVLERIDGVRLDDVEGIRAMGVDPKVVAHNTVEAYFKMVLVDGFFHGDPHPGNVIVRRDGTIGFMDFGIMGKVNDETRAILSNVFTALLSKDFEQLVDLHILLGLVPEEVDIDTFRRNFKSDLSDLIEPLYGLTLSEINFAEYMSSIIDILVRNKTKVLTDMLLIDKAMIMLQSTIQKLDPHYNFIEAVKPYMTSLGSDKINPKRILDDVFKHSLEVGGFLRHLPKQLKRIMWKVIRDEVVIKLSLRGLDNLIRDIDRSSNRLSVSMIISSVLISSAIMHATGVGPTIYGMSVLGFMVFGFAAVLGIALIVSIFRSGRL